MLHATTVAIQVTLSIIDLRQVKLVLAPFRSSIVWHKIKLKKEQINNNWVLLDTYSIASVTKNASLTKNIQKFNVEEKLLMLKTGGHYISIIWGNYYFNQ